MVFECTLYEKQRQDLWTELTAHTCQICHSSATSQIRLTALLSSQSRQDWAAMGKFLARCQQLRRKMKADMQRIRDRRQHANIHACMQACVETQWEVRVQAWRFLRRRARDAMPLPGTEARGRLGPCHSHACPGLRTQTHRDGYLQGGSVPQAGSPTSGSAAPKLVKLRSSFEYSEIVIHTSLLHLRLSFTICIFIFLLIFIYDFLPQASSELSHRPKCGLRASGVGRATVDDQTDAKPLVEYCSFLIMVIVGPPLFPDPVWLLKYTFCFRI